MKPACLPEQLLCSAVGPPPAAASARVASSPSGQWVPHSRQLGGCPAFLSIAAAAASCAASRSSEAQASAISASVIPYLSANPPSTSGRACSALTAERG